jgi:sugar phosphate permease
MNKKCLSGRIVMNANVERTTIRKVYLRLLPLLFVSYFVCYLDRINVGFAALTMNKDLGFTEEDVSFVNAVGNQLAIALDASVRFRVDRGSTHSRFVGGN